MTRAFIIFVSKVIKGASRAVFERALDAGAALGVVAALVVRDVQAAATKIRRERRRARLGHADDDDGEADAGFERGGGIAAAEARGRARIS